MSTGAERGAERRGSPVPPYTPAVPLPRGAVPYVLAAAGILAQIAHPLLGGAALHAATAVAVVLLTAAAVVHAAEWLGRAAGVRLLGTAAGTGLAAEAVGVRTGWPFGRYHYTDKLGPGVGGVPFAVGVCWAMMAGPSWAVACRLSERRLARAALAAGAITAWDVALDPRMVREGWWVWDRRGRYEGIPATNFLG